MLNRMMKLGLAALFTTALSTSAWAQEEDDFGDDFGEDMADDGMGDDMADDGMGDDMADDGMADDGMADAEPAGDMAAEGAIDAHSLTLPAGKIRVDAALEINLSEETVGDPLSIAPDVWYGVNDDLTVGLAHSTYGITGYYLGIGDSLCLSGDFCGDVYTTAAVKGLFKLSESADMSLAADGGIVASDVGEGTFSLRAGVKGMWRSGQLMVGFNPAVHIGLTDRTLDVGGGVEIDNNKEMILAPVDVGFMVNEKLIVGAQTGVNILLLSEAGDTYQIPFIVGGFYKLNAQMGVGATVGFPQLLGADAIGGGITEARALNGYFTYNL